MKILITGTPGTGKTTLAKLLAKRLKHKLVNEKDFALKNKIGKINKDGELEIPLKIMQIKLKKYLENHSNVILEGHVLSEIKLPVDLVFVLTASPKVLEKRLSLRKYKIAKILDNVFCEETLYCKRKVLQNYPASRVFELKNDKNLNKILKSILNKINEFNSNIQKKSKRGKDE